MDILAQSIFEVAPYNLLTTNTDVGSFSAIHAGYIIQKIKEYPLVPGSVKLNIVLAHNKSTRTSPIQKTNPQFLYSLFDGLRPAPFNYYDPRGGRDYGGFVIFNMIGEKEILYCAAHYFKGVDREEEEINLLVAEEWCELYSMLLIYSRAVRSLRIQVSLNSYLQQGREEYHRVSQVLLKSYNLSTPFFFYCHYDPKCYPQFPEFDFRFNHRMVGASVELKDPAKDYSR